MPKTYRTISGDCWDYIAFKCYPQQGGEKLTSLLIDANPAHRETVIFRAGVTLTIPEAYIPASETLPPWMR